MIYEVDLELMVAWDKEIGRMSTDHCQCCKHAHNLFLVTLFSSLQREHHFSCQKKSFILVDILNILSACPVAFLIRYNR